MALGSVPHPGSTVVEVWVNCSLLPPHKCGRAGPGVMRVGELALHLCSTVEFALTEGVQVSWARVKESWPCYLSAVRWCGLVGDAPCPSPLIP